MADYDDIVAEYKTRVDKLLSSADVESCFKGWDGGFDLSDITQEVLNVYEKASGDDIKYKAWTILKDILIRHPLWFEGENSWILKELPSIDQKALFTDNYKEMIEFCFGYTPEEIIFHDYDEEIVRDVLGYLKDKSLLGDTRDKILTAAIDYGWKDIINLILDDDSKAWPGGTLDKIAVGAIKKGWDEIIRKIINDDRSRFMKEDTKYCLFDYFYTDINRFHSEMNTLFKRVEINLASSFSGIICRDEETYLDGLNLVNILALSGKDKLPFSIYYSPNPEFSLASYSSPATVLEVLNHQRLWIQMRAAQIFRNTVNFSCKWWGLYNGLKSDNRGLVTDVDNSLIGICNSLLIESGFYRVNLPLIVLKDEENILPHEDNIFNRLGEYIAEKQEVILYGRAISDVSLVLDVDENILRAVVLIHELGHYITHAHPLKGIAEEPFDNVLFSRSDPDFLECVAQLFAYWVTKRDRKYNSHDVFDKLATKQSGPYKEYLKHINKSPDMILKAIAVLRASTKEVTISDLKLVVNELKN